MAGRGRGGRGRGGRPPGRPRRASSSSVESVHAAHVRYVKEASILKSLSPSLHSDDWPCFVLNDAVVYQKDWRTLGNLLKVDQQGPLYVRGRLEIDPVDHRGLVRNSHSKPVHIELSPTHSYSIGYEPICIWASGGAGWFEINPAPEYQAMYDDMSEAITLYYEVMKGYEAAKKARRGKKNKAAGPVTLDEVLLKYAVAVGNGVFRSEVDELCDKHHQFLLAQFGKEPKFNWAATSFYHWLKKRHPEADAKNQATPKLPLPVTQASLRASIESARGTSSSRGTSAQAPSRSRREISLKQSDEDDVEMKDISESSASPEPQPTRQSGHLFDKPLVLTPAAQVKVEAQSTAAHRHSIRDASSPAIQIGSPAPTQSPIEFLLEFCDEVEKDFGHGMAKIKPATIHSKLFYKCSIKDYKAAPEITRFYSRALLKSLPDRWHVSPFYAWLQEVVDKPFQPHILSLEEIPLRCVRRNTMRKPSSSALFKPGRSSDGPHSDSSSKKGGKHLQPPLVGRRSGKAAGLRLAVKRPLDSDQDTDDRVTKAAKASDSSDYDEDGSSEESDDEVTVKKEGGSGDAEAVRIVVRAENIPSMSPSGPNGTWTCEEPECGYVVRAANEKAGQDLISAHFKYHEDRVAKISLAMDEGTRGHLPISNLLEKIRALGEKSKKDDEVVLNGTVLPDPIKRRLLV